MYCNYPVKVTSNVTAVVTEINSNPGNKVSISIKAGYAFNRKNHPVEFWPLVTKDFVENLMKLYDAEV